MKKGFTLIELLAVIVILAVIALISIPMINKVIESSKEKSFIVSVQGIIDTAELKLSTNDLGITNDAVDLNNLSYKGKKYTNGTLLVNESSRIAVAIWNEDLKLCAIKNYEDNSVTIDESKTEANCIIGSATLDLTSADAEYTCFSFDSGTNTITSIGNSCSVSSVRIPSSIDGVDVRNIESNAFSNADAIQEIDFTYAVNLINISDYALSGGSYYKLSSIKNFANAKKLNHIGAYAFYNNNLNSDLTIPENVVSIGNNAFVFNNINKLVLNNKLISIGAFAFSQTQLKGNITIPESVRVIYDEAFETNQISSLTLNEGLVEIMSGAFNDNIITSVTIPSTVTTIGGYAFYGNKIASYTIPPTVTSVGTQAFGGQNP